MSSKTAGDVPDSQGNYVPPPYTAVTEPSAPSATIAAMPPPAAAQPYMQPTYPYQYTNQSPQQQQQQPLLGGYGAPQPQSMQQPSYGVAPGGNTLLVVNACPADGTTHFIQREFTPCGICLGVVCFPCGLLCCFSMRETRCAKCGMVFAR